MIQFNTLPNVASNFSPEHNNRLRLLRAGIRMTEAEKHSTSLTCLQSDAAALLNAWQEHTLATGSSRVDYTLEVGYCLDRIYARVVEEQNQRLSDWQWACFDKASYEPQDIFAHLGN